MPHRTRRRAGIELSVLLFLMILTTGIFWNTNWDLKVAAWFYDANNPIEHWPMHSAWLVKPIYDYAFSITITSGVLALLVYLSSHYHGFTLRFRRRALFMLLVILLGPGLVVNLVLKNNWGRPRPVHVVELGGQYAYVPPGKISNSPDKSFVCGHCSVGYSVFALYFLAVDFQFFYLALAVLLGLGVGVTRMTSGGHFISDVLWSGYAVFLVSYVLYYGWYLREYCLPTKTPS